MLTQDDPPSTDKLRYARSQHIPAPMSVEWRTGDLAPVVSRISLKAGGPPRPTIRAGRDAGLAAGGDDDEVGFLAETLIGNDQGRSRNEQLGNPIDGILGDADTRQRLLRSLRRRRWVVG